MDKILLPSGSTLEITLLPFGEAWNVCQVISKVLEKIDFDVKKLFLEFKDPLDLINLKGPFFSLIGNSVIEEQAKICFKKCLYNGLRIDGDTFEKADYRGDFIIVMYFVLSGNISPFFKNLVSFLSKKLETNPQRSLQK